MQEKIIRFLKQSNDFISGEDISRKLKISRSAIWKNIRDLRSTGYRIQAQPHVGYKLIAVPDKLLPAEIQSLLHTKTFGSEIHYFDSLPSTMDVAFDLGLKGAREGAVVVAEGQTQGRGRMGRQWNSPKGKGIYASIILRPKLTATDSAKLTLLSAVCACAAVREAAGIDCTIKWPNDLLVRGKKLGGILTELNAETDRVRFCVVGIGLNVNTPSSALLPQSTSCKQESKKSISRVKLLAGILGAFEKRYGIFRKEGFSPVLEEWHRLSSTIGKQIQVKDANGTTTGRAVGLDAYGGLVIESSDGKRFSRLSGDVVELAN